MNYYEHEHSQKIKTLSIIILIINIIVSFSLGGVFQTTTVKESYYSNRYITEYSYNWGLAITLAVLSVILFIVFYVLIVNVVQAIEDITIAIYKTADNEKNSSQTIHKNSKQTTQKNITQSVQDSSVILQKSWTCPSCGRLNDGDKFICDCGYRK